MGIGVGSSNEAHRFGPVTRELCFPFGLPLGHTSSRRWICNSRPYVPVPIELLGHRELTLANEESETSIVNRVDVVSDNDQAGCCRPSGRYESTPPIVKPKSYSITQGLKSKKTH